MDLTDLIPAELKVHPNLKIPLSKKLKKSENINDQYQYVMALFNFPWLKQEEGEAIDKLKSLARRGHPGAMYEYGFKLYREQTDIPNAIMWLSQSSSYGLARAEFRLGKMLISSPWVVKDEAKALHWFESALKKDFPAAAIAAADLRLNAENESLHKVSKAIEYLDMAANSQKKNPEFYYLNAISHLKRENRNFVEVVKNLKKAINLGEQYSWDVSAWESLLDRLTVGQIRVTDDPE